MLCIRDDVQRIEMRPHGKEKSKGEKVQGPKGLPDKHRICEIPILADIHGHGEDDEYENPMDSSPKLWLPLSLVSRGNLSISKKMDSIRTIESDVTSIYLMQTPHKVSSQKPSFQEQRLPHI